MVRGEPPPPVGALLGFEIAGADGRLIAHTTSTCMILRPDGR